MFYQCQDFMKTANLIKLYNIIYKTLEEVLKKVKSKTADEENNTIASIKSDLISAKGRIEAVVASINAFIKPQEIENIVRWVECPNVDKKEFRLYAMPLDISKMFFESVILPHKTMIFTSATLTINDKFDFFKNSFGISALEKNNVSELILDTPFNYQRQVIFTTPSDISLPDEPEFTVETCNMLGKILLSTERSAFVLFTSYSQLSKTSNELRDMLEENGYHVFIQGEFPRSYLFDSFKKHRKSVLFGTDSFWEGVDAQGDMLEIVIIYKLPFRSPDEPVVEAKVELLKKKGKNPFNEYQLPKAVIKLKQGIGRLIRTKTDRGAIIIFDKRIITKYYGRVFLNSLPPMEIKYLPANDCILSIENFFKFDLQKKVFYDII